MQNAALGMTAFFTEIKLTMSGNLTLIELQTEFHQFADALRTFGHNRAHDALVTQPGASFERIAYMQLKRVFVARHAGDPTLCPGCICVGALAFRYNSYRSVICRFQCKTQASDTAANHHEIVFLHPNRILSIKRVFPKNTASASNEFGLTVSTCCKVSASTSST